MRLLPCVSAIAIIWSVMTATGQGIKSFDESDFRAGEKIIFEDDFRGEVQGGLPSRWELQSGHTVVSTFLETPALSVIEGNYAKIFPRMKTRQFLSKAYTVEFDHLMPSIDKPYGIVLFLVNSEGKEATLSINDAFVTYAFQSKNYSIPIPDDMRTRKYVDKWNHIAIAYQHNQMKVYINQVMVLGIPALDFAAVSLKFGGIGSKKSPIRFTNVRITEGGAMDLLQKLAADGKLVIHDIKFDFNKSTIRPESMGVLKDIAKLMSENEAILFEIQGHTDSQGDDAYNLSLSQNRAEAVRDKLVQLGVKASRLTPKGYGETKPIAENNNPEGAANNRRVEFVKM
jgi:OOP family OmpA-OmpF porin